MDPNTDDFARLQADLATLINTPRGLPPEAQHVMRRADGVWLVYSGVYLREIEGERLPIPYLLYGTIDACLRKAPLTGHHHWLTTAVSVGKDGAVAQIALDGVPQPELEAAIAGLDWIFDGRDYRLRNVILVART